MTILSRTQICGESEAFSCGQLNSDSCREEELLVTLVETLCSCGRIYLISVSGKMCLQQAQTCVQLSLKNDYNGLERFEN